MSDPVQRVTDMLSAPMEAVIIALGTGIARAQRELDRFAIQTQHEIEEDPDLAEAGLQATFYQIPRAELELTIAIALEEERPAGAGGGAATGAAARVLQPYGLRQIQFQPVNATYKNQFNFDVNAASKLKLTIAPVPPPASDPSISPQLSPAKVQSIAAGQLVAGPNNEVPAADTRLAINFNTQRRLWFVLQYRIKDAANVRVALVVVDDLTGAVIKAEKGS
jgi:hypothetical protein